MQRVIDDKKCFECGVGENIHQHHVVPRSTGGTMTIPLCQLCHAKVHGDHMLKIQQLAKISRRRKIEECKKLGIPHNFGRPRGTGENIQYFLKKSKTKEIIHCLKKGMTYKEIEKKLNVSHGTISKASKFLKITNNPYKF